MADCHVLYTSKLVTQSATLTASEENSEYPGSNAKDLNYSKTWRTTGADATPRRMVIDFGSAVAIDAIALLNINIQSTATVTFEAHTADSWGAPAHGPITITATGMDGIRRNIYHALPATQTYRYWRINITDNGNPNGFIEVGTIFMGMKVALSDMYTENPRKRTNRPNVEHRTEWDQAYVYKKNYGYVFDLSWENCEEDTAEELLALDRAVEGNAYPFVLVLDDTDPALAYYVRFPPGGLEDEQVKNNVHSVRSQFIEEKPGITVPR